MQNMLMLRELCMSAAVRKGRLCVCAVAVDGRYFFCAASAIRCAARNALCTSLSPSCLPLTLLRARCGDGPEAGERCPSCACSAISLSPRPRSSSEATCARTCSPRTRSSEAGERAGPEPTAAAAFTPLVALLSRFMPVNLQPTHRADAKSS